MKQLPYVMPDWPMASWLWGFHDGYGVAHASPYGYICEGTKCSMLFPAELDVLPVAVESAWSTIFSHLSPLSDTVAVDVAHVM